LFISFILQHAALISILHAHRIEQCIITFRNLHAAFLIAQCVEQHISAVATAHHLTHTRKIAAALCAKQTKEFKSSLDCKRCRAKCAAIAIFARRDGLKTNTHKEYIVQAFFIKRLSCAQFILIKRREQQNQYWPPRAARKCKSAPREHTMEAREKKSHTECIFQH
jgi:hypothetical protein